MVDSTNSPKRYNKQVPSTNESAPADVTEFIAAGEANGDTVDLHTENETNEDTVDLQNHRPEPLATHSSSPQPPLPVIGSYRIISEIGQGGMGKVYKAHHPGLDKLVAIKVMLPHSCNNERERNRFLGEARITAKLHHPNIVTVHDVGTADGQSYLIMDFIEGETLAQSMKRTRVSPKKALELLKTIAEAMEYAHQNGVIHRDLKPQNIILKKTGEPVVMDFGLAKDTHVGKGMTRTGDMLGTPKYMATEQVQGKNREISPRTDVYALGAILYELLTGVAPFEGVNAVNVFNAILHDPVVSPRRRNPRISQAMEKICLKALAKVPAHRYASAGDLAQDIERALHGQKVLAAGEISRPARVLMVALAALLLLVVMMWQLWPNSATPGRKQIVSPTVAIDMPEGWRVPVWQACWKDQNGFLDFANDAWNDLSLSDQWNFASSYQQWYANKKKVPVEKTMTVKNCQLAMVLIPPGRFWMGSFRHEPDRDEAYETRHIVSISRHFWIQKTELTQQQWTAVTGARPWQQADDLVNDHPDYPACIISWQDIQYKFLSLLPAGFALPTEAQWEYSCRAGVLERYYWGSNDKDIGLYANVWDRTTDYKFEIDMGIKVDDGYANLAPVGKFKPNAFGLHDMLGNVSEWCQTGWVKYPAEEEIDPAPQNEPRIIRGGNAKTPTASALRCAFRGQSPANMCFTETGFRLVFNN